MRSRRGKAKGQKRVRPAAYNGPVCGSYPRPRKGRKKSVTMAATSGE